MSAQMSTYKDQLGARERFLKMQAEPITHRMEIRWDPVAAKWVVSKPQGKVWRGVDKVEWTLIREGHPDASAHFQFSNMKLLADLDGQHRLSKDMTASIGKDDVSLTLQVHGEACRRTKSHHYAVWISDTNGGEYAVGEDLNPPPELNVGP